MYHNKNIRSLWKEEEIAPFSELILTWNAFRPNRGSYSFHIRIKVEGAWSPFMLYACWGSNEQAGSIHEAGDFPVKVHQDAVLVLQKKKGEGFQIKVIPSGGADLQQIYGLHVYTNSEKTLQEALFEKKVVLDVKGLSQLCLDHPHSHSLCSPTSTTAVLRYLTKKNLEPTSFAEKVWDRSLGIYGNWVFNVAESASHLGLKWDAWVERLHTFSDVYIQLQKGIPVIVSIKGPLKGSGTTGESGHLIVISGYDPSKNEVLCMDPGLPTDKETIVSFPLPEFMKAWERRGKIAYMFVPANSIPLCTNKKLWNEPDL